MKNKSREKFSNGVLLIILSITISTLAFISEDNRITGFVTLNKDLGDTAIKNNLIELKNIDSLKTFAVGNYYVDGDGIVYWIDDKSKPAIAKVKSVDEIHKNRHIYIDKEGRIGYVLESISINEILDKNEQ